ncbi:hypothetical protein AB4391_01305 [Vibrio lentus]|uniref:Uncharacterized protein n=1 Tax=Vibrio lentus TaxID=136468 RepID=A0A2N7KP20_9VIBR|nr:hypothetical protein [Vibrio lentus]PMM78460.1 hypothetical protein BCT49_00175 [Vibrio lentus]
MKETHLASIQSLKNANLTRFMSRHEARIQQAISLEELAKRRRFGMPYRAPQVTYQLKDGFLTEVKYRTEPQKKNAKQG